jgi:hypothetical protein
MANEKQPQIPRTPYQSPDFAHHKLKCRVCSHPKRHEIEQDYLRWRSPEKLARDYGIPDHSSIYRHLHATGLSARRRLSVRAALERILERSDQTKSSDFDVVRAVSAYAHLDDQGRWQQPNPQNTIIFVGDPTDLSNLPDLSNLTKMQISNLQRQANRIQSPTRENRK